MASGSSTQDDPRMRLLSHTSRYIISSRDHPESFSEKSENFEMIFSIQLFYNSSKSVDFKTIAFAILKDFVPDIKIPESLCFTYF